MIYRPPYHITSSILRSIQTIGQLLGQIDTFNLNKPPTQLRRENRIKSIHSSLAIEGNSLSLDQVTAIINNQRILAPQQDIIEVQNAIETYALLPSLNPSRQSDLLRAHKILMSDLISDAGQFRKGNVGVVRGSAVEHLAPPSHLVTDKIKELLSYLKDDDELTLIKGCVFHYEFEFIHPFSDGNGRMGRLWQTLILLQEFSVFEFIPVEHMIRNNQSDYYLALATSDKKGHSTPFIEFMLYRIQESLSHLLEITNIQDTFQTRIQKAQDIFEQEQFSRKDYMKLHKSISPATASRDLKKAVEQKLLSKSGDKRMTRYRVKTDQSQ